MEYVFTGLITLCTSAAIFGFIQFMISRSDKKRDKQQEILNCVKVLRDENGERWARNARMNILRFDDSLIDGAHHSREYFRSILEEIDAYNDYCREHPEFKNSYTLAASAHINRVYSQLVDRGDFKTA